MAYGIKCGNNSQQPQDRRKDKDIANPKREALSKKVSNKGGKRIKYK